MRSRARWDDGLWLSFWRPGCRALGSTRPEHVDHLGRQPPEPVVGEEQREQQRCDDRHPPGDAAEADQAVQRSETIDAEDVAAAADPDLIDNDEA